jgi:hypothetical protein
VFRARSRPWRGLLKVGGGDLDESSPLPLFSRFLARHPSMNAHWTLLPSNLARRRLSLPQVTALFSLHVANRLLLGAQLSTLCSDDSLIACGGVEGARSCVICLSLQSLSKTARETSRCLGLRPLLRYNHEPRLPLGCISSVLPPEAHFASCVARLNPKRHRDRHGSRLENRHQVLAMAMLQSICLVYN